MEDRTIAAIKATMETSRLRTLSLETALSLFKFKVAPVASYAIEVIWPLLNYRNIKALDRVKSRYLKRTGGVLKNAPTRLVYRLAGTTPFIEDLQSTYNLIPAEASEKFLEE